MVLFTFVGYTFCSYILVNLVLLIDLKKYDSFLIIDNNPSTHKMKIITLLPDINTKTTSTRTRNYLVLKKKLHESIDKPLFYHQTANHFHLSKGNNLQQWNLCLHAAEPKTSSSSNSLDENCIELLNTALLETDSPYEITKLKKGEIAHCNVLYHFDIHYASLHYKIVVFMLSCDFIAQELNFLTKKQFCVTDFM